MATIEIHDAGHVSSAELDDAQMAFLGELRIQAAMVDTSVVGGPGTYAAAADWAIEQAREAWAAEGEQDGPGE